MSFSWVVFCPYRISVKYVTSSILYMLQAMCAGQLYVVTGGSDWNKFSSFAAYSYAIILHCVIMCFQCCNRRMSTHLWGKLIWQLPKHVIVYVFSTVTGVDEELPPPLRMSTPYGGRLIWQLPSGNNLTVHLKDKNKIRHRKRWSQVTYWC